MQDDVFEGLAAPDTTGTRKRRARSGDLPEDDVENEMEIIGLKAPNTAEDVERLPKQTIGAAGRSTEASATTRPPERFRTPKLVINDDPRNKEPKTSISVKGPISVIHRVQVATKMMGVEKYWPFLSELMDRAGLPQLVYDETTGDPIIDREKMDAWLKRPG